MLLKHLRDEARWKLRATKGNAPISIRIINPVDIRLTKGSLDLNNGEVRLKDAMLAQIQRLSLEQVSGKDANWVLWGRSTRSDVLRTTEAPRPSTTREKEFMIW